MPNIRISKSLISELPEKERDAIDYALREKSKGYCHLCLEPFNWAGDSIEADHDEPKAEDGPTSVANLNLAHVECNRAKRNAKTVPIRPYLQLRAFLRKHGPLLKHDGVLPYFSITPMASVMDRVGGVAMFHIADGPAGGVTVPVHSETNLAGTFDCVFVELPQSAIFNDDKVQPRTIKEGHA